MAALWNRRRQDWEARLLRASNQNLKRVATWLCVFHLASAISRCRGLAATAGVARRSGVSGRTSSFSKSSASKSELIPILDLKYAGLLNLPDRRHQEGLMNLLP